MYTLLNPDPATILTKKDYEVPRTFSDFETWWQNKHDALGATKETRAYARLNEGLPKRFYGEAQPMLALMRAQPPDPTMRCQVFADDVGRDSAEDAVYINSRGKVAELQPLATRALTLPITTSIDRHALTAGYDLIVSNRSRDSLRFHFTVNNSRRLGAVIDGGRFWVLRGLATGDTVLIESAGYDPQTINIQ